MINVRACFARNIPASPWQSALSTHGHDSPDASHGQELWDEWKKASKTMFSM